MSDADDLARMRAATTAAADQVTAAVFHDQETIEALTTLGQTASLLVERLVGRGIERSQAIGTVVAAVATSVSCAGGGR